MAKAVGRLVDLAFVQLAILGATWLAGIYVNGYVPIFPGASIQALLAYLAVDIHVFLAVAVFSVALFLSASGWARGQRWFAIFNLLAFSSIGLAALSGLLFVLEIGDGDVESMSMAAAFITAFYLTFLSMLKAGGSAMAVGGRVVTGATQQRKRTVLGFYSVLVVFYLVFISGMYVNIFVAGPIFSLPPSLEQIMLEQAIFSPPFVVHAALGGVLFVALLGLTASVLVRRERRSVLPVSASTLLVGYSLYVGSLNLSQGTMDVAGNSPVALLAPLLSSAGLIVAIGLIMSSVLKLRDGRTP